MVVCEEREGFPHLHVVLGGRLYASAFAQDYAQRALERHLDLLRPGQGVFVDYRDVEYVEPEVIGVLLYLVQRAVRERGLRVIGLGSHHLSEGTACRFLHRLQVRGEAQLFASEEEVTRFLHSTDAA